VSAASGVRLAFTLGDPAGVGPEIVGASLARLPDAVRAVHLYGDMGALRRWESEVPGRAIELRHFDTASGRVDPGVPRAAAARGVVAAIEQATRACLAGEVDAIVTGPLSKEVLGDGGYTYPGHTELLGELCGVENPIMLLAGGRLRVVPATIHCALREVPERLGKLDLASLIERVGVELERCFALESPRIAVCGLNPHASDGGRFGDEEARWIGPAVESARARGVAAFGPLSADSLFSRVVAGEFDVVIGMYHDQVLAPLKLHAFGRAVNVTLGLPIIRTSVDHGTAFEIAGRGVADPGSMEAAVEMAVELILKQRGFDGESSASAPESSGAA